MASLPSNRALPTVANALILIAIGMGAFLFRAIDLDRRPMHTDEAVHAVKTAILMEKGDYEYDPTEYHGPSLYYLAAPLIRATGARTLGQVSSSVPMRMATAIAGTALVLLLLLFTDALGPRPCIYAAVLTAVSPAMVFYSRYYIQEILLVFFTFAFIVCAWRYSRARFWPWALAAGFATGLMPATKESCIIAFACMVAAALMTVLSAEILEDRRVHIARRVHHWHALALIKVGLIVAALLLSAFLARPGAITDALLAYWNYFWRAVTGGGSHDPGFHLNPWYFYIHRLAWFHTARGPAWSEALILLLAAIGIVRSCMPSHVPGTNHNMARFLAFFGVLLFAVYCLIPYKTPWNILGALHILILMAGLGAHVLLQAIPRRAPRALAAAVLIALTAQLAAQAYRASYKFTTDIRNPYVYAQTVGDILNLSARVDDISRLHPAGTAMPVQVIVTGNDYWPLPWYLRRLPNTGYWAAPPETIDAPIIIASTDIEEKLDSTLGDKYQKEYFGLRPDVILAAYIESDIWNRFIATRQ